MKTPEKFIIVLVKGLYVETVWIRKGSVEEYELTSNLHKARVYRSDSEYDTNEVRELLELSPYLEVREYFGESE